ncbi:MAG: hypothetical protein JWM80_4799 [Cyanobacteria bacterium RYN_339]|nr:hypothetical protein [Cyanobacteria bacterium RYN_339]
MAGQLLMKPPGSASLLAGRVTLDASYIVANSGGTVISDHGSAFLGAGATTNDGGRLIANNGGGLIADNAGNVIVGAETPLLSDHGSALISDQGTGLIANNGGGLTGKTKRQLLDAEQTAYGSLVPAAGVELHVRSLRTGERLPVGVGPDGKPVYGVYSNLAGGYELYVAEDEAANVLVEATIPQTTDKRQQYALVAPKDGSQAVIDEDTGLSSREIQEIFAGRFSQWMVGDPASWLCIIGGSHSLPEATRKLLTDALTDLHGHAVAAGVKADPDMAPAVRALSWRCAGMLLAALDLSAVKLGSGDTSWGQAPEETPQPALEAVTQVFRVAREAATPKLAADPAYFEGQPYFTLANACAPGRYTIKRPSDLNAFLMAEYLVDGTDPGLYWCNQVFLGIGAERDAQGVRLQRRLNAALNEMATALAKLVLINAHGELDAVHQLIAAFDPKAVPDAAIPNATPSSCPRPVASGGLAPCLSKP